ncbi:MAG: tellurite resistance TerB family protein [Proteobacteria bacterium]|nr:tellurite resistance TerB family protein [Pseudomonadota bacterium]
MAAHHDGLIYTMVLASACDGDMTDREIQTIGNLVQTLPAFIEFNDEYLPDVTRRCAEFLADEEGLADALDFIRDTLPAKLYETAYAVACDVVAADGEAGQEELRMLEMIRHRLDIDRLSAAAIERGARARHMVV